MAKRNLKKGLFITFEGPEGSGKSTQAKLLYKHLTKEGFKVVFIHEPGTTNLGRKIRSILLSIKTKKMTNLSEMLLYMTSRAQLIEEKIKPALKVKQIIICDRFLDSTLVYQGYGLGMDLRLIKMLGKIVCQNIKPSLTILLDLDPNLGLQRSKRVKDRIERRNLKYHNKVRRGYLDIAKKEPNRVRLVVAKCTKLEVHKKVAQIVSHLIKKNS